MHSNLAVPNCGKLQEAENAMGYRLPPVHLPGLNCRKMQEEQAASFAA
jgi:hypothetical protein